MRTWTIVLIVLGVAVAGLAALSWSAGGTPVETALVQQDDIREFVDERGKTRLPRTHLITMPFDGRIEAIDLVEGTRVKKDQIVARVVPRDLELSVQAASTSVERLQASLRENDDVSVEKTGWQQSLSYVESMNATVEAAKARADAGKARLDYAQKNHARIESLVKRGARTEDDLDQAHLQVIESDSNHQQDVLVLRALQSLQAATALLPTAIQQYMDRKGLTHAVLERQWAESDVNLQQVVRNQARGVMSSPVDGVVLERLVSDERQLAAGTVLLRIGQLDELEVETDILSQDVVNVKPGDAAEVYGPAIGPAPVAATVMAVYPAGFTKVSSLGVEQQRVKVVLQFAPQNLTKLRQERDLGVDYRVRVRVFTAEAKQALVVPRSALFRGAAGQWQVFVVRRGRAELQPVKTGLMNDDFVQIVSGAAANDEVVLAPETNLADGTRVRPTRKEIPPPTTHAGD